MKAPHSTKKHSPCGCLTMLAEGGRVQPPPLTDEEYDARLLGPRRPFRPVSGGRRPEALNASRGVNMPAQTARGWVAGTLGLPGDLEQLGRMAVKGYSHLPLRKSHPLAVILRGMNARELDTTPALPTSDFYLDYLPGKDERPAAKFAGQAGSLAGGAGATDVVRLAGQAAKPVAMGALRQVDAAMRGEGPLRTVLAPAAPMYAIRPRGGNFSLGPPETWDGRWIPENLDKNDPVYQWQAKQLANYIKRDLGAPTDPLLQLEKEAPGLHFANDEAWPVSLAEIENLYRSRESARQFPSRLLPQKVGPEAKMATRYLDKHEALSGGETLTRWGRAADSQVPPSTAKLDLAAELEERWPISGLYPDKTTFDATDPLGWLARETDSAIERLSRPAEFGGKPGPTNNTRLEKVRRYRAELDEALKTDWRAKNPDAETFSLLNTAMNDLGFSHVVDYLDAATEPYSRLRRTLSDGLTGGPVSDKEISDYVMSVLRDGPGDELAGLDAATLARWRGLNDAGLLIDPATLKNVSVPDAVRKTIMWNNFLENQTTADGLLGKGWKVFKEYGPQKDGFKWVEFSKPEAVGGEKTLVPYDDPRFEIPQDVAEKLDEEIRRELAPRFRTESSRESDDYMMDFEELRDKKYKEWAEKNKREYDAAQMALREGLSAEGDAMGHCVGGYCDDVISRGTKIYSLRDAKGRPHVTIEVRPGKAGGFEDWMAGIPDDLYQAYVAEFDAANPGFSWPTGNQQVRNKWMAFLKAKRGELPEPPPEIVQIKGKSNAAPKDEYLPFVQDFVKSGKWGRVGDLRNAGLVDVRPGKGIDIPEGLSPGYYTDRELEEFARRLNPGASNEAIQRFIRQLGSYGTRYARGGSVQPVERDPEGFLPRTMEEAADYLERLVAQLNGLPGRVELPTAGA